MLNDQSNDFPQTQFLYQHFKKLCPFFRLPFPTSLCAKSWSLFYTHVKYTIL